MRAAIRATGSSLFVIIIALLLLKKRSKCYKHEGACCNSYSFIVGKNFEIGRGFDFSS
jgi:hypothetical protein